MCGFAQPAVVRGRWSANQFPDLPDAFAGQTCLFRKLDILL